MSDDQKYHLAPHAEPPYCNKAGQDEIARLRADLREALEIIAELTEGGEELDEMLRDRLSASSGIPPEKIDVTHPEERRARAFLEKHNIKSTRSPSDIPATPAP